MKSKSYLLLYLIATILLAMSTLLLRAPGYMDADYYYAGGIQVYNGNLHSEPYIWNYLNNPESVPAPSFSYWMPLTSFIAAAGMKFIGSTGFNAARLVFVLLAGFLPLFSARISQIFLPGKQSGWLAGVFAIFSIYYFPFLTTTDSFSPLMVLGGLAFLLMHFVINEPKINVRKKVALYSVLGVIAGLFHLLRADGFLWLFLFLGLILWREIFSKPFSRIFSGVSFTLLFIAAYFIVTAPWLLRNYSIFGSFVPNGGSILVWARSYNDIFLFDHSQLRYSSFIEQGIMKLLVDRGNAMWTNLKGLISVNGGIVFSPIIIIGMWKHRKNFLTRFLLLVILINFAVMSILFPYAGARGGFFHSNSVVQCVLWGFIPVGLNELVDWGVRKLKWLPGKAWMMFGSILIITASFLTMVITVQKISGKNQVETSWNTLGDSFLLIEDEIVKATGDLNSTVMVNNPPGYYLATNRLAIVNPSDGLEGLIEAGKKYSVRFVVLDKNNQEINEDLKAIDISSMGLYLISEIEGNFLYELDFE